jgi:hypothetical protein
MNIEVNEANEACKIANNTFEKLELSNGDEVYDHVSSPELRTEPEYKDSQ